MRQTSTAPSALAIMIAISALGAGESSAQQVDPARLPAARAGTLAGIVLDSAANPIAGVEIRITSPARATHTALDGTFRLTGVPAGRHEVRARRIGFAAQGRRVQVPDSGAVIAFELKAVPWSLPAVVTVSSRRGLSGVVSDTALAPLPAAQVRVYGAGGQRTVTDELGAFHIPLSSGGYMIEVWAPGHRSRLISVTIPSGGGREVAVALHASASAEAPRERIAMWELRNRLAWRTSLSTLFTREDLAGFSGRSLTAVLRTAALNPFDNDTCLVIVNGQDSVPIWYFDADELESVEVYPPGTLRLALGTPRQRPIAAGAGFRGGAVRVCPAVYVWRR